MKQTKMDKNDRTYKNDEITVYWKPRECIHATICYKELIDVFNPSQRPWVDLSGASNDKIIEIIERCPTDALTFTYNDGRKSSKPPEEFQDEITESNEPEKKVAKVEIIKGGPLLIEGNFTLIGEGKNKLKKANAAYFCRCGQSGNMPFCDGSHRKANFNK
ncbi:(4Fe-4S)-binding protein [Bacteroidota bacterium]